MGPQIVAAIVRRLLDADILEARVELFNSFATTFIGHRTNIAVAAGLLGLAPTDPRTPQALAIARERGLAIEWLPMMDDSRHDNALVITAWSASEAMTLAADSIGGGNFVRRLVHIEPISKAA